MPLVVSVHLSAKTLHMTYDTNRGQVQLAFPMLRCRLCTKCNEPVSVWALGSTAKLPDLHAHRGGWRVHSVNGGFVLAAPEGHNFDSYDNPTCQCETVKDALGRLSGKKTMNLVALAGEDVA